MNTHKCEFCKDANKFKSIVGFSVQRVAMGEKGSMSQFFISSGNELHFETVDLEEGTLEKEYMEINFCPICGRKLIGIANEN